ncbi:MAG: hypothetical protein K8S18_22010 [Desulfobacula sp.]|nr:hypothetical protein [Desulfobacula sp.]
MKQENRLQLFQEQSVRTLWDEDKELWYFSIIDVVAILTKQTDYQKARKYWNKLKERLTKEGNETVTNCHQLKMIAKDGKMRMTDVTDKQISIFRRCQRSIGRSCKYQFVVCKISKTFIRTKSCINIKWRTHTMEAANKS